MPGDGTAASTAAAAAASTTTTTATSKQPPPKITHEPDIHYRQYTDERDLPLVMALVDAELSEPYSIFTYRCVFEGE